MSNYIIQGETLAALGDAIRSKTGETEPLTPVDMATAISEISGLPGVIEKIDSGVFTPTSSNYLSCVIEHGLGDAPDFVVLIHNKRYTSSPSTTKIMYVAIKKRIYDSDVTYSGCYFYLGKTSSSSSSSNIVSRGNISSDSLGSYFNNENFKVGTSLDINTPYIWICGKFADFAG